MKVKLLVSFLLMSFSFFGNTLEKELKNLEGIWIAEPYYNSFVKTSSAIRSKSSFDPTDPFGLRINSKDVQDGVLSMGFSCLHDHFTRPEASNYIVLPEYNDTIRQPIFKVQIKKPDSLQYYELQDVYLYFGSPLYFSWHYGKDTSLTILIPASAEYPEKTIKYKRVLRHSAASFPFPSPIYSFTRKISLSGHFELRDSLGNLRTKDFYIDANGVAKGDSLFENKIYEFNTDIYCGEPLYCDIVCFYWDDGKLTHYASYIYKRMGEKRIFFHALDNGIVDGRPQLVPGKLMFTLDKD
ncbi:MAG: hypothetical protein ACKOXB_13620 [Flavobacteriales bacterium]